MDFNSKQFLYHFVFNENIKLHTLYALYINPICSELLVDFILFFLKVFNLPHLVVFERFCLLVESQTCVMAAGITDDLRKIRAALFPAASC